MLLTRAGTELEQKVDGGEKKEVMINKINNI
jgi:hypothetical protein